MVSLHDELARCVDKLVPKNTRISFELQHAWEHIASPQVREHTDGIMFSKRDKDPVILIYVNDSSWAAELSMQKEFYRIRMEEELGKTVKEVRFIVSRIASLRKE